MLLFDAFFPANVTLRAGNFNDLIRVILWFFSFFWIKKKKSTAKKHQSQSKRLRIASASPRAIHILYIFFSSPFLLCFIIPCSIILQQIFCGSLMTNERRWRRKWTISHEKSQWWDYSFSFFYCNNKNSINYSNNNTKHTQKIYIWSKPNYWSPPSYASKQVKEKKNKGICVWVSAACAYFDELLCPLYMCLPCLPACRRSISVAANVYTRQEMNPYYMCGSLYQNWYYCLL